MRNRGFEKVKKFKNINFNLPKRATKHAAGYDFESPIDDEIMPGEIKMVTTGVKAYMKEDEVLELYSRSSHGKKGIMLANSVAVIDGDYYNNPDNEGEISFLLRNTTDEVFKINKGDRIGQGVFKKFLTIDNEQEITDVRKGGFGSTNKKGITLIALAVTIIILIIILGMTTYMIVYNIKQSRINNYLSEVYLVQTAVLEEINLSKFEEREINSLVMGVELTAQEKIEFASYADGDINDDLNQKYRMLGEDELSLLNIANIKDTKKYIVNWNTAEVINATVPEFPENDLNATYIKAGASPVKLLP